ncbi:hypothetical protein [Leucobacter viscericola]|uniref:hypothetical protein n=1 Tax=Leucobacter viscericola TaxID=2714935 RepID=UPI00197F9ACB|nr:hypothetical protein [Leucobacter viscericola]
MAKKRITGGIAIVAALAILGTPGMALAAPSGTDTYVEGVNVTPTQILKASSPVELTYTYGASDQKSSVVSFEIPTPLVYNADSIKLDADNLLAGSLQITLVGRAFDTDTDGDNWDGSFYRVSYQTVPASGAHEYPSTLYFETSRLRVNTVMNDLPITVMNDGALVDTKHVSVKIPGTKPTVINTSVDNGKYADGGAEVAAAHQSGDRESVTFNEKQGIGTIDLMNANQNIIRTSINPAMMSGTVDPTGVRVDATLPYQNSVFKADKPVMAATASGLMFAIQKIDLTQPNLPNIPGITVISSQFTEVGGNYGDPLGNYEVRISTDPATNQTHIEYYLDSLPRDSKLFLVYNQKVENMPSEISGFPDFLGKTSVTWDQMDANTVNEIGTWQTPYRISAASVDTVKSVDKDSIHPGDALNYSFDFTATKDATSFWVSDTIDSRLPIKPESVVSDNAKCVPTVKAETNVVRVDCADLMTGDKVKISVGVDTNKTVDGDKIDNTYYLGTALGFLKGNDVSTAVTAATPPVVPPTTPPVPPTTPPTTPPVTPPTTTVPTNGTSNTDETLAQTGAPAAGPIAAAALALMVLGAVALRRKRNARSAS